METFRTLPPEEHLEAFICNYRYTHPANLSVAYALAERGEPIVPVLLDRLEHEEDEQNQEPIIYVFEVMYKTGHLRDREDVVNAIRRTVSKMKNPTVSQRMLDVIHARSRPKVE